MKKNTISKIAALVLAGMMTVGFAGCDSTTVSDTDNSVVDSNNNDNADAANDNANDNANPDPNNDAEPAPPAPSNNTAETFKDYSNKKAENGKSAKWIWMDNCTEDVLGDGSLFEITFRIKQDAADGNYNVVINDFAMCHVDVDKVVEAKLIDGVVTVGNAEAPTQETVDETYLMLENAKGNAGDTITMVMSISKNPGFTISQLGVNYDSSALEIVDIKTAGILSEIGSVQMNLDVE